MAKLSRKFEKNIAGNYELALTHYRNGAYSKAEEYCRKVLSSSPRHADASHLLALIALAVGNNDVALQLAGQAASKKPQNPIFVNLTN